MRLNQYVAVRAETLKQAQETLQEARGIFGKPGLLAGMRRTYEALQEGDETLPPEVTVMQHRGPQVLQALADDLAKFWDASATVDAANCTAKADVVVDGKVLLANVPATHLLFLEKQLDELDTVIRRLPTLDPAQEWGEMPDPTTGTWKTKQVLTIRTKKVLKALVKYEATDKHPAQTETYTDDVPAGRWTKVEESSAFPIPRVLEILSRVRALRQAVKLAREEANTMTVSAEQEGKTLLGYLLAA